MTFARLRPLPDPDHLPALDKAYLSADPARDLLPVVAMWDTATVLVANAGKVMTNPQLLRAVWGPSHVEQNHYLRVYMGNLRQKLEAEPKQPRHFLTVQGLGYKFRPAAEPSSP